MTNINRQSNLISAGMLARCVSAVREVVAPSKQPDVPAIPLLVIDAYWQDLPSGAYPGAWHRIAGLTAAEVYDDQPASAAGAVRAYHGVILKATQGDRYIPAALRWFDQQWAAVEDARITAAREGDFWRGAYHYLMFLQSGHRQADFYLDTIARAGGFDTDDMRPIVDIEFGGEKASNRRASRQQVIDCASDFSARVLERTGRSPILYGGSALAELKIREPLGCVGLWCAAYTRKLKAAEATSIGRKPSEIIMWQYTDGKAGSAVTTRGTKLPIQVPPTARGRQRGEKWLPLDCSVVTVPGGMAGARRALL